MLRLPGRKCYLRWPDAPDRENAGRAFCMAVTNRASCSAAGATPCSPSIIARDRAVMRRLPGRQIEPHFIDIAPAPPLRWIVAFDDRMPGGMEMLACMP